MHRQTKLIINLAPTGMVPHKRDNPNVPVTPDEIATDVKRCYETGAVIVHLHARDTDEAPTYHKASYAEIIARIRASCPDIIVCVSCSGRNFSEFEKRADVLALGGDLKPDMASLTLGSMNFPRQVSVNEPDMIAALAEAMSARGIVPELEVFELGMIDYAHYLIQKGILQPPFYCNILLGSLGTMSATPYNLVMMTNALPKGATWAATGIGRFQFQVNALAIAMGGHVRVGLEDNLYMDTGQSEYATNFTLVERIAKLAYAAGRDIATPAEARAIIGLPS